MFVMVVLILIEKGITRLWDEDRVSIHSMSCDHSATVKSSDHKRTQKGKECRSRKGRLILASRSTG